ncbi:glycosyltransferase [Sphingomonas sp. BIUV-7]|uniref:Glycosyltransferase n=1 Tax=Sphingomonas natans TaxID=3063330 RepID=A0ABT8YBU1_9SPHN|nr:glycosyltransferase [Sphingomonas sp. BIUV-7]MDO6415110.1 glycosyltransferase [Sphingomonas sp. BIUV-7]
MILPARAVLDAALLDLSLTAMVASLFMAAQTRAVFGIDETEGRQVGPVWAAAVACGIAAAYFGQDIVGALVATLLALMGASLVSWAMPRLTAAGALAMAVQPLLLLTALPWSLLLLSGLDYPTWALMLWTASGALGVLLLGFTMAGSLVRQATMTHMSWRRPTAPLPPKLGRDAPMISVQIPCYAEPPELVIATLDGIAAQNYPNFEVMVCDNNTKDETLWRPVEAHCRRLNAKLGFDRFRFFHVAPLDGAKAGALNWLMPRMDKAAKLVAVLDADYDAEAGFLSKLAGFFDDPKIGYVQTPHDYRAYEASPYLRACYWEYMPTNKVVYPGINEYNAAFTIGTMCIVRADAIRDVGGWAEWCLTEDSEISVRLRAMGYDGVYLPQTFGRGLIPETFEDYRKQRFRWCAGPVQQLRRYWRYYLPRPFGLKSGINGWSKLLEFQRSAAPLVQLVGTGFGLVMMTVMTVLSATNVIPDVVLPGVAWGILAAGTTASVALKWRRYRLSGCERISDMLLGEVAQASLSFVQMTAAIAGLSSKPQPWRRTPKFAVAGSWQRAIDATKPEAILGSAHLALIAALFAISPSIGGHMTLLASVALLMSGARFLAAPAMALLGERELARQALQAREQEDRFAAIDRRRTFKIA